MIGAAAAQIRAADGTGPLQVVGFTDSTNTAAHNLDLSERRAQAVASQLRSLLPARTQISVSGMGEANPVADNSTSPGRALNRRVSIVYTPAGAK